VERGEGAGGGRLVPPPSAPRHEVRELLHGREVVDPYRYLEDGEDPRTRAFAAAQTAYARALLDRLPGRAALRARLEEAFSVGALAPPVSRRGRLFYARREAGDDQPKLCLVEPDGSERVLYDPAWEGADGLVSLDWWYPSPDGSLVAYGTAHAGDEWSTLRVLDVAAGRDLPDRAPRARAASVAWDADGGGFVYTRYPAPGEVPPGEEYYHRRLFHHRLGAAGPDPEVAYAGERPREEIPLVHASPDGRHLAVEASRGWSESDLYVRDRARPDAQWRALWVGERATFSPLFGRDRLYVLTDLAAPNFRLVALPLPDPAAEGAATVLPEDPEAVLWQVAVTRSHLVAVYGRHAAAEVRLFDLDGKEEGRVALDGPASVTALTADPEEDVAYLAVETFTHPGRVYRLDAATGSLTLWRGLSAPELADGVWVRQRFFTSRDGTRVPLFLIGGPAVAADAPPTEPLPLVLEGYGGFRVSRTPQYLARILPWLRRGGLYAVANLRGGGEYGEAWHRAGMGAHKQNVFDDALAAAEHLVAAGYTRPDRLALYGGSNGGLLVGACITQRPDLFRAALCAVPLLDMLRYHRFRLGGLWTAEYGSPDDPEAFAWLMAYSPYHRVRPGTRYPAVLLTTAVNDSRVDPMHALKMAARLGAEGADRDERPVLLLVEEDAGHGAGKPVRKSVDHLVDVWSFLAWQLGVGGGW
jgi:prolyl oligopeptidase